MATAAQDPTEVKKAGAISLAGQKAAIMQCETRFSEASRKIIMSLVLNDQGEGPFVVQRDAHGVQCGDTYVNLDMVAASNPELLLQIYNLAKSTTQYLNTPAT